MKLLLAIFALVWAITFVVAPTMGAGWGWDATNALGFAALAGVLTLSVPGQAKLNIKLHEGVGYAVVGLILGHALWFLLFDAAAIEFIKPGAPAYMWTGVGSLLLIVSLVVLARQPTRRRAHRRYRTFRSSHLALSMLALGLAAHHVIGSGFYLRTGGQALALVAVALLAIAARPFGVRVRREPARARAFLALTAVSVLAFAVVRNGLS